LEHERARRIERQHGNRHPVIFDAPSADTAEHTGRTHIPPNYVVEHLSRSSEAA
jgi:hypothetical protein